jgi:hypothetical protein
VLQHCKYQFYPTIFILAVDVESSSHKITLTFFEFPKPLHHHLDLKQKMSEMFFFSSDQDRQCNNDLLQPPKNMIACLTFLTRSTFMNKIWLYFLGKKEKNKQFPLDFSTQKSQNSF